MTITNEKQEVNRTTILREFCLNTSTHGLPGIARSQSLHNRLFWSISLTGFTGFMIYLIVDAILMYFDYPTQIDINFTNEWPQYFPAFSFCNIGLIRLDRFLDDFLNFTQKFNLTDMNSNSTISPSATLYIPQFLQYRMDHHESIHQYFYSLSSMLVSCSYNNQPCSATDFISFTTAAFGFCYTFNAQLKNRSSKSVRFGNENGGDGILRLGLYVHSHQYVPHLVDSVGIMGLVHDNRAIPGIEILGSHLGPGRKHKLAYRKTVTSLLPEPYTKCTNEIPGSMKAVLANYPNGNYDYPRDFCFAVTIQLAIYRLCGCVDPSMWHIRSIYLPDQDKVIVASLCDPSNTCPKFATIEYMAGRAARNYSRSDHSCPPSCSKIEFLVSHSSSTTPLDWQFQSIKNFVENSSVPLPADWSNHWRERIHQNYLIVSVECESVVVENRTQTAQISLTDLLANIGGQTGLWIGISLLSIMEMIEMIYRLGRHEFRLFRFNGKQHQTVGP